LEAISHLDRPVHTAHRLSLDGETLREPPEKSAKRGGLDTDTTKLAIEAVNGSYSPQPTGITVRIRRNPRCEIPQTSNCLQK
jgi:hypothetical protein